jgi:hypothetical protein
LLDQGSLVLGWTVALFFRRSSSGSMDSATASSSIALSRANDPLASDGARMIVVGGTSRVTTFLVTSRDSAAYVTSEMPPGPSEKLLDADFVPTPSCLRAVSVPSARAPSARIEIDEPRCPTTVKVCSRVSAILTGRPSSRAAAAASGVCAQFPHLLPNPPPTCGLSTWIFDASIPSVLARRARTSSTPWLAV